MPITDPSILNPAAYGTRPVIPATSTNTTAGTSGWTTGLPNYGDLAALQSGNLTNQLGGTLDPQDLANAAQWSAERGIQTGVGIDSPNAMAAYQQFLGLSRQKLKQQGMENLNAALNAAPRTTSTTGTQTIDNNVLAALTAAAPDPYAAAMANLAAQQQGLAAGRGSIGGTSQPGNPPIVNPNQGGPGPVSGGGGGTGPFAPSYDPMAAYQRWSQSLGTGGQSGFGTGQSYMGPSGQGGSSTYGNEIVDSQGNAWIGLGDGTYMNTSTGDIQQGTPDASTIFGGIDLGGGQSIDPFNYGGFGGQAYGSMPDYSQGGYYDPTFGMGIQDQPSSGMMDYYTPEEIDQSIFDPASYYDPYPSYDITAGMQNIGTLGGYNVMQSVGGSPEDVYQQVYGSQVPEGMAFDPGMDTLSPAYGSDYYYWE